MTGVSWFVSPAEILRRLSAAQDDEEKKGVIARSEAQKTKTGAIQGEYMMIEPWIASPASKDAGSQ
jgi:hypothetical protein